MYITSSHIKLSIFFFCLIQIKLMDIPTSNFICLTLRKDRAKVTPTPSGVIISDLNKDFLNLSSLSAQMNA